MENEDLQENTLSERPNKSQQKREMVALREQAALLPQLKAKKLKDMELDVELITAIEDYSRIKKLNAQKRHMQYITRLLSEQPNLEEILDTLHAFQNPHLKQQQTEKQVYTWLNHLILEDHEKIDSFLANYPVIERQQLMQLIRNTKKEISKETTEHNLQEENLKPKEGKQQKKLKKLLRDAFNSES